MFASAGMRFDVYEILGPAGQGGMGEVYRARDVRLGRQVAVKFIGGDQEGIASAEARFEREARLASSLNHPGIVTVLDVGSHDARSYVVMEWIDGGPLYGRIMQGPLPLREIVDLASQIADALAVAHEAGIVHRDLKPGNVMVTPDGRAKIVDFGLSRSYARSAGDATVTMDPITQGPVLLGTPGYASPEQVRGEPVGPQADQFAFGAMLYELLTNTRAFRKDTAVQTMSSILVDDPPAIEGLRAGVPHELTAIVRRCLQKRPNDRYASTRDLAAALKDVRETMVVETRTVPLRRPAAPRRTLIVAVAAIAIVAAIGVWSWRLPRESAAVTPAIMPAVRHIVVMPFANITQDAGDQVFADGLVETLTSSLSSLERFQRSMRVVPASEVRGGRITTVKEARQAFGCTLAITGSIQRLPETTRLTFNVVDAEGLVQLASRTVDVGTSREALTQDSVITTVTTLLALELEPQAQQAIAAGGTRLPAAYDAFVQGRGFLQRFDRGVDNVDRAIEMLSKAVTADPQFVLARTSLAEALSRKYDVDKQAEWIDRATAEGERALAIDNRVAAVHVTLSVLARVRGRYEEAVVEAQRAIELDAVAADGYRELGRAYESLGRLADVESTYQRAITARPDDWLAYQNLGTFYISRARWADAEAAFKKVIELTPDNTRPYNNLGVVYFRQDRLADAVAVWEKSLSIRPTNTAASNLGTYYYNAARYADSARAYERAVELSPNDRRVWRNLGAAAYWANLRERSTQAFERALALGEAERKINPRQAGLLAEIADSAAMLGRRDTALEALHGFERLNPLDAGDQFTAATAYEVLGDRTNALRWLEKAMAAGIPRQQVERSATMTELRKDPRFVRLIPQTR